MIDAKVLPKILPSLLLMCALAAAGAASAQQIEFDSASDVSGFTLRTSGAIGASGAPTSTSLAYGAASGRLGGGGLAHANGSDVTAVYQASSFDLTVPGLTFSLGGFFFADTTVASAAAGNVVQFGLSANDNTAMYADAGGSFIATRLQKTGAAGTNGYQLQGQYKLSAGIAGTNVTTGSNTLSLTASNWYRLTTTYTRTSTAGNFSFSSALENWGADGSAFVSTVGSYAQTLSNTELYNDTTTYAAFRTALSTSNALDSLTLPTAVPEPTTGLLLTTSLLGLAWRRRRS